MSALTDVTNHMTNPQDPSAHHSGTDGSAQNGSALTTDKAAHSQAAPSNIITSTNGSGGSYPTYTQDTAAPQSAVSATAPQSALSSTSPATQHQTASPTTHTGAEQTTAQSSAPATTTNGHSSSGAAAAAAPAAASAAAVPAMKASDVKKYDKLLQKEQKDEEKHMANALKDAKSAEKTHSKSKEAEAQAVKRFNKAAKAEHKANKKFERAQTAHQKALADKQRLEKEVEIKKQHSTTTSDAYEKAKQFVDSTRKSNSASATTRAQRQSEIHGTAAS